MEDNTEEEYRVPAFALNAEHKSYAEINDLKNHVLVRIYLKVAIKSRH